AVAAPALPQSPAPDARPPNPPRALPAWSGSAPACGAANRPGHAPRPRKPDSGHTGTVSLTIRMRRASRNAVKPRPMASWRSQSPTEGIQCVWRQAELHDQLKPNGSALERSRPLIPRPGAADAYRRSRKYARDARESEGNVQVAAPTPADDQRRPSIGVERPPRGARRRIVWFIRTS